MVTKEQLKQWDYDNSHKLSKLLAMDSKIRFTLQILTQTGTVFGAWAILLVVYFIYPEFRAEILTIFVITAVLLVPVFILKQTVRRSRPEFKDDRMLSVSFDKFSFPSGHATRATYSMIMLPIYVPNLTILWLIWGLTMIASRLLLGVHYISDIIVGIILGSLSMWIILSLGWIPVMDFVITFFDFLL